MIEVEELDYNQMLPEEEKEAYIQLKSDGLSPFENSHMPADLARMMVSELICKDSLLKEEVRLLQDKRGRDYLELRMFKEQISKDAIAKKGNGGVFWRG